MEEHTSYFKNFYKTTITREEEVKESFVIEEFYHSVKDILAGSKSQVFAVEASELQPACRHVFSVGREKLALV